MAFNWTCPHCSITQTVVDNKRDISTNPIGLEGQSDGSLLLQRLAIGCSNPECLKTTVKVMIGPGRFRQQAYRFDENASMLFSQVVIPQGSAKPQPDYIPSAIREDYYEACLIRDLSPKASATLTRRCLQGMIRDFVGIKKNRLVDEIEALRNGVRDGSVDRAVSLETVEAIDHVRGVGNIGAHMEADIDHIVPVDPGEAQALIDLVEMLFDEWYSAREKRKKKLARISGIAGEKKELKSALKAQKALQAPAPSDTDGT